MRKVIEERGLKFLLEVDGMTDSDDFEKICLLIETQLSNTAFPTLIRLNNNSIERYNEAISELDIMASDAMKEVTINYRDKSSIYASLMGFCETLYEEYNFIS